MGWKYDDKQAEKMFLLHETQGLQFSVIGKRFGTTGGHAKHIVARYRRSLPGGTGSNNKPVSRQPDTNKRGLSTPTKTKGEK